MYGGWDGKKWLSDVYVMDTSELTAPFIQAVLSTEFI
jgi:hypothetical protein